MKSIRKITIGTNYKQDAMHYIVGQKVINNKWEIHLIKESDDGYELFIEQDDEVQPWKFFNKNMGISVEYNFVQ